MAQATRSAHRTAAISDDPMENFSAWLQMNAKPVGIVVGVLAVATAAILIFRASEASKRERASVALYTAQAPLGEGKLPEAATELQKVIQRYGGTLAGQQAALLLAQVHYEQRQFAEGLAVLEKARGDASREFAASMDALIAAGHESAGNHEKAAEAFGRAASEAEHSTDRIQYEASQARALMSAGKLEEAKVIWTRLSADETQPFAQEARVRLGEIAGAGK